MSYEATFTWPHPAASNVVLTGTFDNWSCSYPMKRTSTGFTEKVNIPYASKVLYKFVVDGQWLTSNDAPTEWDHRGNVNNVFNSPAAPPPAPPSPEFAPVAAPIEVEAIKEEPLEDDSAAYVVPDTPTTAVETPRSPIKELFIPVGAPAHEKDIPVIIEESPRDVPVVEISPPEEHPSAEETGTGLGEDPALARAILESLEDEEDKVVVPEKAPEPTVEVKKEEEAPVVEEAPAPAPAPVSAPAPEPTPVPEPVSVPVQAPVEAETPAPIETPAPAPVVEAPAPVEVPAPAPIAEASTPRPSTPPPKVLLPVEPTTPVRGASTTTAAPMTSSAFSSTTTASSTTHSPEKPKPFPSRVSSESSPAKSLPKSEKRKKRPSFIKRITRVFSHKE